MNLANGPIFQYSVLCTNGSAVIIRNTSDQDVIIAEFAPNKFYNCTILATTSAGEGPVSDAIEIFTGILYLELHTLRIKKSILKGLSTNR